jgi:hypothetical protein
MAFEAATLLQLVLLITWTCLSDTPAKQKLALYTLIFTSQADLEEMASRISLEFAPGLFSVLRAAAPPTVQYFKSLPTNVNKRWAVYLLVLEKPGFCPRIYIGSGTEAIEGVTSRLRQYNRGDKLPLYIEKAVKEGYTINHIGLLCWTSIPPAVSQARIRLLFLALKATFSYIFWAVRVVNKDYGMSHICLWDTELLEYDSLCSHCCLREKFIGEDDFELSAEQLEAKVRVQKEKRAEWKATGNANYIQKQMETNYDEYSELNREKRAKYVAKNPEKVLNTTRNVRAKNYANKTYYCELCNHAFYNKAKLTARYATPKHLLKADYIANRPHQCIPCKFAAAADQIRSLKKHLKSQRHLKMMAALSSPELD